MKDLCSEKEPLHWPFSPFRQSSESSYRSTVLLPSTSFPARIEGQARIDRDRQVVKSYEFTSLYDRQKSSQEGRPRFVLHDGPPYANGDVHLGHAVNKILKDVFCRWKLLTGILFFVIPGAWPSAYTIPHGPFRRGRTLDAH